MSDESLDLLAFERVKLVRLFLGHAKQLPALMDHIDGIKEATTLVGKWEYVKAAGDLLVPIAQELKDAYSAQAVGTLADCEAHAVALGLDWARFILLLPKLQEAVVRVRELIDLFTQD